MGHGCGHVKEAGVSVGGAEWDVLTLGPNLAAAS
jgi:hypothetical protein